MLRMAGQTDPRAAGYYRKYEDELLRTGCPIAAFAAAKREALLERKAAKEVEAEAEAEVVAVSVMDVHSNGTASI